MVRPISSIEDPSGALNTTLLSNGSHQLRVRAAYSDNSTAENTVTVSVANGGTTPTPTPVTLTVVVVKTTTSSGTGNGTVTSTPAGINCGSICSASYASGSHVTLIATAAAGSSFVNWSGTGCANGAITMDASKTCTATFTSVPDQRTARIGVFRPDTGEWFLDRNGNGQFDGCSIDECNQDFGVVGDIPVAGDWNGLGNAIGVFRPSTGQWFLDGNNNGQWDTCAVEYCILQAFGDAGTLPVVGNWSGGDAARLGFFRPSTGEWVLDMNGNSHFDGCSIDKCNQDFGLPGDLPVVGDWNGLGNAIGVFRPSTGQWFLDGNNNGRWDTCAVEYCILQAFGDAGTLPVVGDWSGEGAARLGFFRPSTGEWVLDMNGNGHFDGCAVDACLGPFGHAGDLPVIGKW